MAVINKKKEKADRWESYQLLLSGYINNKNLERKGRRLIERKGVQI